MGRQTSRIWYQQKDHKEMVTYNGRKPQYHDSAWIWKGNRFQLVWKKLYTAVADPIIGVEFDIDWIPYKVGDYFVGSRTQNTWRSPFGTVSKIHKSTHAVTELLEGGLTSIVQFSGISEDGRIAVTRNDDNKMRLIDVESGNIILSREIELPDDPSSEYYSSQDFYAAIHHKFMFQAGDHYCFETPTMEVLPQPPHLMRTSITRIYRDLFNNIIGYVPSCRYVTTISMGSYWQSVYGLRRDPNTYVYTFVELIAWGAPDYQCELISEKSFPFNTVGNTFYYMDNGHLIMGNPFVDSHTYYVFEIPSLDYFTIDISEIENATVDDGLLTVSPSGNTIIYQSNYIEPGESSYKSYKKDKDEEHWHELICSNASYNFQGGHFDLTDDSVFFARWDDNGQDKYQAYKLRQG